MSARMIALLLAMLLALPGVLRAQDMKLEYHGAGWAQFGKVENSYTATETDLDNYNNNWMQNTGGQISVSAKIDSNWDAGLALGVVGVHLSRGNSSVADYWYPFWVPYVGEARVTYSHGIFGTGKFRLTLGNFGYGYSGDNKNLGLYLLRGYVYPGAVESGFGSIFGGVAHYEQAGFSNDLIIKSEDERPVYDLSLADVVSYKVHPGFEVGAGVNFYRLIPQNSDLTSPGTACGGSYGQCFIPDTVKADTGVVRDTLGQPLINQITGSLSGVKLMARFRADAKLLFGLSKVGLGKQDLVLYGEAAVLGLKEYPVYYDDLMRRIPVMLGFNLPVFDYLDFLSVEVEYYASKNSADNVVANFGGGWVPATTDPQINGRDDLKWSVNVAKTLFSHMQLTAQVANDHLRLGGWHNAPNTGKEVMRTPEDWYWTCKLAYFF